MSALYSYLVWECAQALDRHHEVILCWVKVQVGYELNEEADALAKEGAGMEAVEPLPIPKAAVRNLIESFFCDRWSQ